jgi:hypothetical protein
MAIAMLPYERPQRSNMTPKRPIGHVLAITKNTNLGAQSVPEPSVTGI